MIVIILANVVVLLVLYIVRLHTVIRLQQKLIQGQHAYMVHKTEEVGELLERITVMERAVQEYINR